MNFRFTRHALEELQRRGIPQELAEGVCAAPEQQIAQPGGRVVYQSRVEVEPGKIYLVRVFIDPADNPPAVITVYRTSKIEKYWRTS
jgi:hypothetical protein